MIELIFGGEALFPCLWKKHRKSQHAKFQQILSNLKNHNEIGTYIFLRRSPSILIDIF